MKRQHPDNPDLFWCPKCRTYKVRGEFAIDKRTPSKTHGICRECNKLVQAEYRQKHINIVRERCRKASALRRIEHPNEVKASLNKWKQQNPEKINRWRAEHPEKKEYYAKRYRIKNKLRYESGREALSEAYVTMHFRRCGLPKTPETIEFVRQRIIMKRTLKQFKEWRKEYESNNPDVQREQRENEEADGRQGHAQP